MRGKAIIFAITGQLLALCSEAHSAADCGPGPSGDFYRQDVILNATGNGYVLNVAVDHETNTLYYSHQLPDRYYSFKTNLDTKDQHVIEELPGECVFTVDQKLHEVYAGCSKEAGLANSGLYKYDSHVKKFVLIGEEGENIKFVYFHDILYYGPYYRQLRTFVDGHSARVESLSRATTYGLEIDKYDNKFIVAIPHGTQFDEEPGLFEQKVDSSEFILYPNTYNVADLAANANGDLFACDNEKNAIFYVNKSNKNLTKVANAPDCWKLTFDKNDNLIYSTFRSISISRVSKC